VTSKKLWIAITGVVALVALGGRRGPCDRAWFSAGLADLGVCPDGHVRQVVELAAHALRRGAPGEVTVKSTARYVGVDASDRREAGPRIEVDGLALIGADKVARPLAVAGWAHAAGEATAELTLPEVPDGDYQLRAHYRTALGDGEVDAPLALYAPARIHVLTDRPLYEPGNTMRFRAVALRAHDLTPLDQRPGVWVVRDPDNEVLLEEAAPAGAWGVAVGSFPLDKAARAGTWKIAWRSAGAIDEVEVRVEPFTLPRFRIDAIAGRPFYQAGDRPTIKGAVLYSSGAPVAGAKLEIAWDVQGAWPPPTGWQAGELPRAAVASANGRFELALPQIPADLQGTATLTARIAAVDGAGDRVTGAAQVLLSEDAIAAQVVTELGDGLVEGYANRAYVRVTTPDGRVVSKTKIRVTRSWQPEHAGDDGELDEDGVASLVLDPGVPVNVVIPARPWRPAPRPAAVARGEVLDLISGGGATLADQLALDRWLPALAGCAKWVDGGSGQAPLGLRADAAGRVIAVDAGGTGLERCAAAVARAQALPRGAERLYAVALAFTDPGLPQLVASVDSTHAAPAGLAEQVAERGRGARDCLPEIDGKLATMLAWRARAGVKDVELMGWLADPSAAAGPTAPGCLTSALARGAKLALAEPAAADAMGVVRFAIGVPTSSADPPPQATTMLGYELVVTAALPGAPSTKVRVPPGAVPPLRMRITPVIAAPGGAVTAELIRGPAFAGKLPEKLALDCRAQRAEATLDAERRATFTLDPAATGWCTVSSGGGT
jgi:hypothetical protein